MAADMDVTSASSTPQRFTKPNAVTSKACSSLHSRCF
jgi:hypothetical protein